MTIPITDRKTTLANSPYFDDYDEDKKYAKILFRPGFSVQSRELTQLQTILQKQIERCGRHFFKEGSMVIPGYTTYDLFHYFAKVRAEYSGYVLNVDDFLNLTVEGQTSFIQATIVDVVKNSSWNDNDVTTQWYYFYLKYIKNGINGETEFISGTTQEVLKVITPGYTERETQIIDSSYASSSTIVGTGSCVTINEGVYFVHDHFVKVNSQKIFLDQESNQPSYRVGLKIIEEIVTESDDITLTSNATGSPNYTAPGAHRLKIDAILIKIALGDVDPRSPVFEEDKIDPDFVELLVISNGVLYKEVKYTEYNIINDTLARRTYDESGDYTVRPFLLDIKQYLDDGENNGIFQINFYIKNLSPSIADLLDTFVIQGSPSSPTAEAIVTYHNRESQNIRITNLTGQLNLSNGALYFYSDDTYTTLVATAEFQTEIFNSSVYPRIYGQENGPLLNVAAPNSFKYDDYIAVGVEAGKAYVKGYEVEKIGKSYIPLKKARNFVSIDDKAITTTIGNYVLVDSIYGVPNCQTFQTINLYDKIYSPGTIPSSSEESHRLGTAKIKAIEYLSGTPGETSCLYKLYLYDLVLKSGNKFEQVKYIVNVAAQTFTCNINSKLWKGVGKVKVVDTSVNYGIENWVIEGFQTRFDKELVVGDIVVVNPSSSGERSEFIVKSIIHSNSIKSLSIHTAGSGYSVGNVISIPNGITPATIEITSVGGTGDVTGFKILDRGKNFGVGTTGDLGSGFKVNILSIMQDYVDIDTEEFITSFKLITENGINNQIDVFMRFATIEVPSLNRLIFNMPNNAVNNVQDSTYYMNVNFTSTAVSDGFGNYDLNLISPNGEEFQPGINTNYIVSNSSGAIIEPLQILPDPNSISDLTQCKIKVSAPGTYYLIATLKTVNGVTYRHKYNATFTKSLSTSESEMAKQLTILLDHTDVYKILSVRMSPNFSTPATLSHPDVKDRFDLDSGQRDNIYDYGRIVRKPGAAEPNGLLLIEYEYYFHETSSATRTFYCSNSYPNYSDIPEYFSTSTGIRYRLRDCLDFRPDVFDLSNIYIPKPNYPFTSDYIYYLNRVDNLWVDTKGIFRITEGVSALKPVKPSTPSDGLVLYNLHVKAYTFTEKEVMPEYIENKRYTMRDIGRLEKRIENLEYYSSLSLLEKQTKDLEVKDENGLERFKLGFVVDNFTEYSKTGDGLNPEASYSIDEAAGECRPEFYQDNVKLSIVSLNDLIVSGQHVMLPYVETKMVDQPYATYTENVNPYNVFTFLGYIELNPPFDEWKDTVRNPDNVVMKEGSFESLNKYNKSFGGIHWNDWETSWVGSELKKVGQSEKWVGQENAYTLGIQFPINHYSNDGIPLTPETAAAGLVPNGLPPEYYTARVPSADNPWPIVMTQNERWTEALTTTLKTEKKGVKTTIVPREVKTDLGDKVVSVDSAPFMRKRKIHYVAKRMKPNTQLYAFFDNKSVTKYCTNLMSDAFGVCEGDFNLPAGVFKTGSRIFRLTDKIGNEPDSTTRADVVYRATGTVEKVQKTILSTVEADVVTEHIRDTDEFSWTTLETKETNVFGPWIDPISQTFLVDSEGGAYLTSVDIFFRTKEPGNIPIELQIREVVNGYPGSKVLPFARVIKTPSQINVSEDASIATQFKFLTPVYVQDKTEYAICLIADSNAYEVFIATKTPPIGADQPAKNIIITPSNKRGAPLMIEPYLGSFFKSQNSSTWTAEQETDLKFVIRKAQFFNPSNSSSASGNFVAENVQTESEYEFLLELDPIQIVPGNGKLRVYAKNHGMQDGDYVSIYNIERLLSNITPISQLINVSISDVDVDSFTINNPNSGDPFYLDGDLNYSGRMGGVDVILIKGKKFDTMHVVVGDMLYPQTEIFYTAELTDWLSQNLESAMDIIINQNKNFEKPKTIFSNVNQLNSTGNNGKMRINAYFRTYNSNITPVININRFSAILINNIINNPSESVYNIPLFDYKQVISQTGISFIESENNILVNCGLGSTGESTASEIYNKFGSGKYIESSGVTSSDNMGPYYITKKTKSYDPPSDTWYVVLTVSKNLTNESPINAVTITQRDRFVEEVGPRNTSSSAKYITKRITLKKEATALKVQFAAYRDVSSSFEVYYKLLKTHDDRNYDDIEYRRMSIDVEIPPSESAVDLKEYSYSANNLDPFVAFSVKIVMKGNNSSLVPRVVDFRAIALDA